MVLPISDDNSDRRLLPVVNYILIAVNVFVFVVLQGAGTNDKFTYEFACIPWEIVNNEDVEHLKLPDPDTGREITMTLPPTPGSVYLTLLTSMFLHGSIMHLAGNMLFLWIFGDNVEDSMGHARYLVFYLVCGVLATFGHIGATYLFGAGAKIPSLGASGAISGVLGGYLLLHPYRRVTVILLRVLTDVPAWVAIGIWFLFQIISGLTDLGGKGGVAYGAHVGGFIAGVALVKVFAIGLHRDYIDQRGFDRSERRVRRY